MKKGDALGDRIKSQYEDRTRFFVPRRTFTVCRIDGKSFHSYVKKIKCAKPYDVDLMDRMNMTARFLCENIEGSECAYVASDEISILLTDMKKVGTQAWFDGNIQKMASVSASLATGFFGSYNNPRPEILSFFDSRVFTIPDRVEVANYFYWRYKDWLRNSISMLSRAHYSHKELEKKKISDMHEMLHKKGVNWSKEQDGFKNGRLIYRDENGWKIEACGDSATFRSKISSLIPSPGYE